MIIDTETASPFKPKGAEWWRNPEVFPKLAQLSYIVVEVNEDKEIHHVLDGDYIIYPRDASGDYEVQNTEIHGITTEMAKEGIDVEFVLRVLIDRAKECDLIVGHNLYFDMKNILAAGQLNGVSSGNTGGLYKALRKEKRFDTMLATTNICKLPKAKGTGYKWAKLEELHAFLFDGEIPENLHNSLEDCRVTAKCLVKLITDYPKETGLDKWFLNKYNTILNVTPVDEDNILF